MELLPPVLVDSVEVVGSGLAVGLVWLVWLCLVWLCGLALSVCLCFFFIFPGIGVLGRLTPMRTFSVSQLDTLS